MGAQENLQTVERGYKCFMSGDVPGMLATWGTGITFHSPGRGPLAGTFRGQDEVLGFLQRVAELSGGTWRLEIHDITASSGHVVVLCRQQAERAGRSVDMPAAHIWHVQDGKLTEAWFFVEDLYEMDEFWT